MTVIGVAGIPVLTTPFARVFATSSHSARRLALQSRCAPAACRPRVQLLCGITMEGLVFRQLNKQEMLEVVPRLKTLARSSSEDKKILVGSLREPGEIVGVTGDGTNDGPTLKAADVASSMGTTGTEVAK